MSKLQDACDLLRSILSDEATNGTKTVEAQFVLSEFRSAKIGVSTLYQAKTMLGIEAVHDGRVWRWKAPSETAPEFDRYMEASAPMREHKEPSMIVSLALTARHVAMLDEAKEPGESRSATARRLIELACQAKGGENVTK